MPDYPYDVETYPNCFTFTATDETGELIWQYEISERRNDVGALLHFLWYLANSTDVRMVGFNNEGFDYPVIHYIMQVGECVTVDQIYVKAMSIINSEDRFGHIIWESDRFIPQLDLYKIHHFDNRAKSTSLKAIEFAMRSESIEDLPYAPGTILTFDQMDVVLDYNKHDVTETSAFYHHSLPMIRFREELSERYERNFINFNDTKIGKEYFISELEKAGVNCYDRSTGRREPRQTIRHSIRLADVILPYIQFNHPAFQGVLNWLSSQIITETKGVFKDLTANVNGFEFVFGLGGIHGSIDSAIVESTDDYEIVDLDVTSFYPSLAIVNQLFPAHLSKIFCRIYAELKKQRVNYKKGSAINAMLKLALNGTFGDSNNPYSVFYDPQFTMAITINGQLSLCMLAERLMAIPGLRMIQANTDGVTIHCPRNQLDAMSIICKQWETLTGLELENVNYSHMFIRDVNNYFAEKEDGKIKRKGAYCYETPLENPQTQELQWHQDHSARVVAKAAEAALLDGEDIRNYITTHPQQHDFMIRAKVPRNSRLMHGDEEVQRISRYYISTDGRPLMKIMPPVKGKETLTFSVYQMPDGQLFYARLKADHTKAEKKGYQFIREETRPAPDRKTDINKGWLVTLANNMGDADMSNVNYEWYIAETEKLVTPLRR